MTNHIEELMKAAGVEKQYYSFNSTDGNTYNWELNENGNKKYKKIFIGEPELKERTFTPTKQLELIKLIVEKCQEIKIYKNKYIDSFLFQAQESWGEYEYKADVENFDSCLAALILELLKNNKLDKSKVKRILEDD